MDDDTLFKKEVREFMKDLAGRVVVIETTLRINAEEAARKVSKRQYKLMIVSLVITAALGIGTFVRGFFS